MPSDVTPSEWDLQNNPETVRAFTELPSVQFTIGAEAANVINVALQLVDGNGNALAQQVGFYAWLSDTALAAVATTVPDGDVAIGTNGLIVEEFTTDASFQLLTDANGELDLDIGESLVDTWYLNVLLPGGAVVSSDAITFA